MIARDIELVKYTGSKIHFTGISTSGSVELIRKAKAEGVPVSCSVTPYHLCFCDEDLKGYDTNLKVDPPLRTREEREALKKAVIDGVVDCIATHHLPHDIDHKIVEFEYAHYGMTGLETAFGVVHTCLPQLSAEQLVNLFSLQPRKIFGFSIPSIKEGSEARISLFQTERKWSFRQSYSRSKNSAFFGKELTGKPAGIINKDKLFLNQ